VNSKAKQLLVSLALGLGLTLGLLCGLGITGSGLPIARAIGHASLAAPWTIFTNNLPPQGNLLINAGFEDGPVDSATGWSNFVISTHTYTYTVDNTIAHGGTRSLKLNNLESGDTHGALQVITLNQTEPRPLYFSGWSKAECVTGSTDDNYSL
jgi:hypothetical protein